MSDPIIAHPGAHSTEELRHDGDSLPAVVARIRTIIAPWFTLKDGSRPVLSVCHDGGCRLYHSDDSIIHETITAAEMLDWVTDVNAAIEARINGAGTINSPPPRRGRPLDPVVAERRRRVAEMAKEFAPASVRQIAYQAEVHGLVPKTENGFRKVQHDLLILRQQGVVDYDWISDNTRWMRKSDSYKGIEHFLNLSIGTYRRDLWHSAASYVEIWIEKDALAGTVMSETDPYDVPLMVARGFSSETYLYEAARPLLRVANQHTSTHSSITTPVASYHPSTSNVNLGISLPDAKSTSSLWLSLDSRSSNGSFRLERRNAGRTGMRRISLAIAVNSMRSRPTRFARWSVAA
jgi:hypothetical protein